jgi:predicted metalloendopeptidase
VVSFCVQLTHGFDDEGRKYDRAGRLRPWWSNSTAATFANATRCLVAQYSAYPLAPVGEQRTVGTISGLLTLGENLADQGGVTLSWLALQLKHAQEQRLHANDQLHSAVQALHIMQTAEPALNSTTPEQLFFIAYAQCQSPMQKWPLRGTERL